MVTGKRRRLQTGFWRGEQIKRIPESKQSLLRKDAFAGKAIVAHPKTGHGLRADGIGD